MLVWLVISIAVTVFLLVTTVFVLLSGPSRLEARLLEVAAGSPEGSAAAAAPILTDAQTTRLGRAAAGITSYLNPIRGLITGTDADLARKLTLAGFRKPQHVEIFTATKLSM